MDNGWIKLHRKLLDSSIFTSNDDYIFQLWCYLLLSVNHKAKKFIFNGEEITLQAGQGIFGLNQIVKDIKKLSYTSKKFKKYKTIYYRRLKTLEKLGNLQLKPTNKFTIITILNWDMYQQDETQVKLKWNSSETQVKTNKNDKNDNNTQVCTFLDKKGKQIKLTTGDKYIADGFSPKDRLRMKKVLERTLGLNKTNKWANLIFGIAWDFKKAFKNYMGYEYIGNIILDEVAKTIHVWYEAGETRETLREMLLSFFQSDKAQIVTVTPNSVFSQHTYNSWKQGKLKIKQNQKKEWWQ